jgi:metal-dependent amidase/aminoacylase/carboxypeptidase family protein
MDERLDDRLVALRRWFHQHPELSFAEAETAKRIIAELNELGIGYDYAGVGHAVIATIDGEDSTAPAFARRA